MAGERPKYRDTQFGAMRPSRDNLATVASNSPIMISPRSEKPNVAPRPEITPAKRTEKERPTAPAIQPRQEKREITPQTSIKPVNRQTSSKSSNVPTAPQTPSRVNRELIKAASPEPVKNREYRSVPQMGTVHQQAADEVREKKHVLTELASRPILDEIRGISRYGE